jgi:AcrR family transcriptional regulator
VAKRARVLRNTQAGNHAQALRNHLVQVTQRLLAAHGLTGLTTRLIAKEAEVSDGVLYNHFTDKDELVITALSDRITDLVRRHLDNCPEPGEQDLRSGLARLARLSLQFQTETLPLVSALLSRPELIHQLLEHLHANEPGPHLLWRRIICYIEAEQQLGTVAADVDPLTVVQVLFGVQHLAVLFDVLGNHPHNTPPGVIPDEERLVAFLTRACAATQRP